MCIRDSYYYCYVLISVCIYIYTKYNRISRLFGLHYIMLISVLLHLELSFVFAVLTFASRSYFNYTISQVLTPCGASRVEARLKPTSGMDPACS